MKKIKLLIFVLLLSATAFAQESVFISRSKGVFDDLRESRYKKITSQFDTSLAGRMDTLKLRTIWNNIQLRMGAYKSTLGVDANQQGDSWIILQHLAFENKNVDLRIAYTKEGQIKALNFLPQSLINSAYVMPLYANVKSVEERPGFVISGKYKLPAILTVPKGPARYPVVILVHGSGANDKDEMVGGTRIFKDLSYGLSANGIAVFRYDKRTRVYGLKQMITSIYSIQDEVLEDVISAIATVKLDPSIDTNRIYLCGHSFGATILPRIAMENKVAGLIMIAANYDRLEDVIFKQITAQLKESETKNAHVEQILDTLTNQVHRIKTLNALPKTVEENKLLFQVPISYWFDMNKYDHVATAKKLTVPMFFIQGGRDSQVSNTEFENWKTSMTGRKARFKLYPDLNHFLVTGKGPSNSKEYKDVANMNVSPILDIVSWINGNSKK